MNRTLRITALLVAIFALLGVSFAAESPEHLHLKSPVNSCDVCLTAHAAAEQVRTVHVLPAPELRWHTVLAVTDDGYETHSGPVFLTRGPPATV